ncbi:MAG: ImmA/IrrE family metallo-endopeptidase [Oscillospiraceae bacterium]|nr:ImmA/IrrE family metallo-endopeptidase [Oscillospiraceae bacterium]
MDKVSVPPKSKEEIINIAKKFRKTIPLRDGMYFPVVEIIEWLSRDGNSGDIGFDFEVVDDNSLNHYADYNPITRVLKVQQSVYLGACNNNGRDRFTLAHELGHVVLHSCVNNFAREKTGSCPPAFRNPEWQANTFGSALLIDRDQIGNMSPAEVANKCGTSLQAAEIAVNDKKKKR